MKIAAVVLLLLGLVCAASAFDRSKTPFLTAAERALLRPSAELVVSSQMKAVGKALNGYSTTSQELLSRHRAALARHRFSAQQDGADQIPGFDANRPGCAEAAKVAADCSTQSGSIDASNVAAYCSGSCLTAASGVFTKCFDSSAPGFPKEDVDYLISLEKDLGSLLCVKAGDKYCYPEIVGLLTTFGRVESEMNAAGGSASTVTTADLDSLCTPCFEVALGFAVGFELMTEADAAIANVVCTKNGGKYCTIRYLEVNAITDDVARDDAMCQDTCVLQLSINAVTALISDVAQRNKALKYLYDGCQKNAKGKYCTNIDADFNADAITQACTTIADAKPTCSEACKTQFTKVNDDYGCCIGLYRDWAKEYAETEDPTSDVNNALIKLFDQIVAQGASCSFDAMAKDCSLPLDPTTASFTIAVTPAKGQPALDPKVMCSNKGTEGMSKDIAGVSTSKDGSKAKCSEATLYSMFQATGKAAAAKPVKYDVTVQTTSAEKTKAASDDISKQVSSGSLSMRNTASATGTKLKADKAASTVKGVTSSKSAASAFQASVAVAVAVAVGIVALLF